MDATPTIAFHLPESEPALSNNSYSENSRPSRAYILFVAELVASVILILIPYVLMIQEENRILGVFSLFIALPAGIFMLVQALAGFNAMKKFKSPSKKSKKGNAKMQKT